MSGDPISLSDLFGRRLPVVGVIHAPPLPGAPGYGGSFEAVRQRVRSDAAALREGGADGVLLENFGDAPFFPNDVPAETISHMTVLAHEVRDEARELPLGVNVLRNDGLAALAIAEAAGGSFIRVNVLAGVRVTDQGTVEGDACRLLRRRRALESNVRIFADVGVKHSAALAPRSLEEETRELVGRAGADAVIVTGEATGDSADPEDLTRAGRAAEGVPVLAGSGVTSRNAAPTFGRCDGVVVGSDLRRDGRPGGPVEPDRVRAIARARDEALGTAGD